MTNFLLVAVLLLGLAVLASGRISGCIRLVAAQGAVLGAMLVIAHHGHLSIHVLALAALTMVLKGLAIPWLLVRSMRVARVQREVDPYLGYTSSLVLGTISVGVAFGLSHALPLPHPAVSPVIVPVSLATSFIGLLLLVTRKKAVAQVLGYLVLENGILTFSLALGEGLPVMVELGILLDIFAAVFIMGIAIYHISKEFDSIDSNMLTQLNDLADDKRVG